MKKTEIASEHPTEVCLLRKSCHFHWKRLDPVVCFANPLTLLGFLSQCLRENSLDLAKIQDIF